MNFQNKSVLVIGAATGIGKATAIAFAKAGAMVLVADIDAKAEETVSEILRDGGTSEFCP